MSTFTNGTGSVDIDFSLLFDLISTPKLVISDTGTYSSQQTNVNIYIKITRPDGIVRNHLAEGIKDITGTSGSLPVFNYILPLSSDDGEPIKGTYKIDYSLTVGNDAAVVHTKSFDYQYSKIKLSLVEDIDEFTPILKAKDTTPAYNVTGFTTNSISRVFTGSISAITKTLLTVTTTGTTSADRQYKLEETINDGLYYDAEYTVNLNVTTNHTHNTYSWVTVSEKVSKSITIHAHQVPTKAEMIDLFDNLRNKVETHKGSNKALYDVFAEKYEYVLAGFNHLVSRLDAGDYDDENTDILVDILGILRNNVIRPHTNSLLTSQDAGVYATVATWNNISNKPAYNPFQAWTQDFSTTTWTVTHNLGKYPAVTVVDDNGNIMYGDITYTNQNSISIEFSSDVNGKVYLN